jgi:hypothetical protein
MKPEHVRHGGAYDRGSADAWYRRPYKPHYFVGATYDSEQIDQPDMTSEEIAAYKQGYETVMESGQHKEY